MISNISLYKRLPLLLVTLVVSAILVVSLFSVFQPGEAANLETETDSLLLEPTPEPDSFNLADPYVCIIPNDGVFLPCHANLMADEIPIEPSLRVIEESATCVDGEAAGYPCDQVDLLSRMPLENFGGVNASDIWGWTDPSNGKEIVILTLRDRTAFVDVSNPTAPEVLGTLLNPFGSKASAWRDVKTYQNTAYIVGDLAGSFGVQIFDLTRLRTISETTLLSADNPPCTIIKGATILSTW